MEPITPLNDDRISPEPNSGCWLWVGSDNGNGYGRGQCPDTKRSKLAHRLVWESHHGSIPAGLEIDHLCRTRCCVNPAHLEPVTPAVNMRRSPRLSVTRCPKGHEYTPENTYYKRDHRYPGVASRCCRECSRVSRVKYKAKFRSPTRPAGAGDAAGAEGV